jgi:hypothetical protein
VGKTMLIDFPVISGILLKNTLIPKIQYQLPRALSRTMATQTTTTTSKGLMAASIPLPCPPPIPSLYRPTTSIVAIPSSSPLAEIVKVLERDGGIILKDLVSTTDLNAIDSEIEDYRIRHQQRENGALSLIPKETFVLPGLVGKSPTVAKICELPVLDTLRTSLLQERFKIKREDIDEDNVIDPLLSISITLHIGYGAPRQRLHRDDNVHGIRHGKNFELGKVSQFGCLIAGTKTTRENGATMFVPGSHLWDDERRVRTDEVCFAGKDPILFLSTCI